MKAVIMAGGQGTRIRSVASDIPKPMIPVMGKPVLEYQIENLVGSGIRDIILVTGYLSSCITEYFGDGKKFGADISCFNESVPMGTAGALYYLKDRLQDDDFLLIMGDLMLSVDFKRFMAAHKQSGSAVTLFVHPNSHPQDSDIILTDREYDLSDYYEDKCGRENQSLKGVKAPKALKVTGFIGKKDERKGYYHNQVNAGIYAISPMVLKAIPEPEGRKVDLDKDIIRPLTGEGKVSAYRSTEYVKDMGTPERYEEVSHAVQTGLVEDRNLSNKQKCVFIDRDGTLNRENGFISAPEDIELYEGAAEAIAKLNKSRYLCVLTTNQPVVARGETDLKGLDEIQKCIELRLGEEGAYLDGAYFCPHHPDSGFDGEVRELKFRCFCRKPEPGLILKAAEDLNIDLSGSYMIGDSTGDMLCGKRAGVKTIGLKTGMALKDGKYDAYADEICSSLLEAAELILSREQEV